MTLAGGRKYPTRLPRDRRAAPIPPVPARRPPDDDTVLLVTCLIALLVTLAAITLGAETAEQDVSGPATPTDTREAAYDPHGVQR